MDGTKNTEWFMETIGSFQSYAEYTGMPYLEVIILGPYLILIFVICFEALVILHSDVFKDRKKTFLVVVAIEIIVFTGLRSSNIGSDTAAYVRFVDLYKGISFSQIWDISNNPYEFEIGYLILCKICSFLGITGTKFLFLIAIIIYVPFFVFVYRESNSPLISILAYFTFGLFYYSLGIFRQMIAISICLSAIPALKENKFVKYICIIGAAMLFHTTAICWIPLYWLSNIDINRYKRKIIPLGAICLLAGNIVVKVILLIVPRYSHYVGTIRAEGGGSYLMLLLLGATYLAIENKVTSEDTSRIDQITIAAIALSVILQATAYSFGLLGRAICYYSLFEALMIPRLIDCWISENSKQLAKLLVVIALVVLTVLTQLNGNQYICPFTFFWQM